MDLVKGTFGNLLKQAILFVEKHYNDMPSEDKKKIAMAVLKFAVANLGGHIVDEDMSKAIDDLVEIYNHGADIIKFVHKVI